MTTLRPLSLAPGLFFLAAPQPWALARDRAEVKRSSGDVRLEVSTANDRLTFAVHRAERPVDGVEG
jgi:hypothetical protein